MDAATRAVSTLVFAAVELFEDEPQAANSAAQPTAVTATMAARSRSGARTFLEVGGSLCMRAY